MSVVLHTDRLWQLVHHIVQHCVHIISCPRFEPLWPGNFGTWFVAVRWRGNSLLIHRLPLRPLQDVGDHWSLMYPRLYTPGQVNAYLNKKIFLGCLLHSCYSSLVLFFVPWAAMQNAIRDDGKDLADHQSFAFVAQTCVLVVVSIQVSSPKSTQPAKTLSEYLRLGIFVKMSSINYCTWCLRCVWTPTTGRSWTSSLCWAVWLLTSASRSPCTATRCSSFSPPTSPSSVSQQDPDCICRGGGVRTGQQGAVGFVGAWARNSQGASQPMFITTGIKQKAI